MAELSDVILKVDTLRMIQAKISWNWFCDFSEDFWNYGRWDCQLSDNNSSYDPLGQVR